MMAILISASLLAVVALTAAIAVTPLFRTLSMVIDNWADGIQGDIQHLR